MKNHLLPWKKKLKKEKLELITTHLKETRAEASRTMTVTGQRLLQEPEAVSDDDDDDGDDDEATTLSWGKHGVRRVRVRRANVRRVTRVSLNHSQRDLVVQEVGVMH